MPIRVVEKTIVTIWKLSNHNLDTQKPDNIPKIMLNAIGINILTLLK